MSAACIFQLLKQYNSEQDSKTLFFNVKKKYKVGLKSGRKNNTILISMLEQFRRNITVPSFSLKCISNFSAQT